MQAVSQPLQSISNLGIENEQFSISNGTDYRIPRSTTFIDDISPINGKVIAQMPLATEQDYHELVAEARVAFLKWRSIPAPKRGEVVRQIGEAFRKNKQNLAYLVSLEMGKTYQGTREVQEIIDICDFAVGLSRQLYGLTMPSERANHRLYEQWQPLGVVGIISAFNFPVAVWAWNAMIAVVCGNSTIWKPSEKTPLCAISCMKIISPVLQENKVPEGTFSMIAGDSEIGKLMAQDPNIALVSATGSTAMGKSVATSVAARLGKSLLELGGNNAIIISQHADLKIALQATIFAAVGTTGQRCTTARRLIIHRSIYDQFKKQLSDVYKQLDNRIGNPLDSNILIGPLIDQQAVETMLNRIEKAKSEGGNLVVGGAQKVVNGLEDGFYVQPTIIEAKPDLESVQYETFAPILYLLEYESIAEAVEIQNSVSQGLSSSIFTNHLKEAEYFLSASGSDCGIANVNIGPSGAEIGGAFGGEKETGGGRESGSDAWKAYMRRQTVTINYSDQLPLAQGIQFEV